MSESTVPSFLDAQYFKKALENGLKLQHITIHDVSISIGSNPGENFMSSIYRALVSYSAKGSPKTTLSLIVKVVPPNPPFETKMTMTDKEALMYFDVLPAMEKHLIGKRFGPKVYFVNSDDHITIVLEDLMASGHRLGSRLTGLDEEHCKVILQKLGQFHALSLLYVEEHVGAMSSFSDGFITERSMKSQVSELTQGFNYGNTIKLAKTWPGFEAIATKMEKDQHEYANRMILVADSSKDAFKVLNHGDMWINNFLFEYDEMNKPMDVLFIDYQFSTYASPGIDINHFMGLCPAAAILDRRDLMIKEYYYKSLRKTLKSVGYQSIPSEELILNEINKKEYFALGISVGLLPLFSMDTSLSQENTFENLSEGKIDSRLDQSAQSSRYQEAAKFWLRRAEKIKLFDSDV